MELYILSKKDLSILSINKVIDYQINVDEETNAKSTFTLLKNDGMIKGNYVVVNGLYRQFIFVIDDVNLEKESNVATLTLLDISNIFNRKIIEKNIDEMTENSIEEFIINTMNDNFINSDDSVLNLDYIEPIQLTTTQTSVNTNAENGLYNFHTFITNCRQYKNIFINYILKNIGKAVLVEGKQLYIEAQNRKINYIKPKGETNQTTGESKNRLNINQTNVITSGGGLSINTVVTVSGSSLKLERDTSVMGRMIYAIPITLKANTEYIITGKCIVSNNNQGNSTFMAGLKLGRTASENDWLINSTTIIRKNLATEQTIDKTFSTTTTTNLYFAVYVDNDSNNTGITVDLSDLMVRKSDTSADYEGYYTIPDPNHPSPIINVEPRNMFNINDVGYSNPAMANYCSYTIDGNKLTITAISATGAQLLRNIISGCDTSKYYVLSFKAKKVVKGTAGSPSIRITTYGSNDGTNYTNLGNTNINNPTQGQEYSLKSVKMTGYTYYRFYIYNNASTSVTIGEQTEYWDIQFEENVETDFVPYNNLQIKKQNKNLWKFSPITFTATIADWHDIGGTASMYTTTAYNTSPYRFTLPAGTYYFSNTGAKNCQYTQLMNIDSNTAVLNLANSNTFTLTEETVLLLRIRAQTANTETSAGTIQIEKGNSVTAYEEHQEQIYNFPLSTGQKPMQGSYLADDGIHNNRTKTVLGNISSLTSGPLFGVQCKYTSFGLPGAKNVGRSYNFASDRISPANETFGQYKGFRYGATLYVMTTSDDTVENFNSKISGSILEYELAEEEIIPYTEEQQTAWNNIKNMVLYEGINNIYSDANLDLKYYTLNPTGVNMKLEIDVGYKSEDNKLIDTTLPEVTNYNKVKEEDVTAKVTVYIRENDTEYNLYLKSDRTTTTNKDDPDRVFGTIEVISVETEEEASNEALNVMKGNRYNHLVEFNIYKNSNLVDISKLDIGTPILIKTDDDVYESYISAINISNNNFVGFKSGNLRTTLTDKLRKKEIGE